MAAAIQNKYNITVVPHILCSGFTREETEYVLLDLQFLNGGSHGNRSRTPSQAVSLKQSVTEVFIHVFAAVGSDIDIFAADVLPYSAIFI